MAEEYDYEKTKAPDFFGDTLSDGMRVHSVAAWDIASVFGHLLASSTRDLAAHIDIERKKVWEQARLSALQECREIAEKHHEKHVSRMNELPSGDRSRRSQDRALAVAEVKREYDSLIQAEGEE